MASHKSISQTVVAAPAWLLHQIKRAQYIINYVRQFVQMSGGVSATFNKAFSMYQREGFAGIKQSLFALRERTNYKKWIAQYDTLSDEHRDYMAKKIETMPHKPLISVVMPTYNPNPKWLREAIESVQGQIYPHWEMCIADDLSSDSRIPPILEEYAQNDSRIKIILREENGHISAATNSALDLVTGDWVALMDHDDLIPEHALYWVADAINQNPNARLIYSDEDKIDEEGNRHAPYFKCDWNPELFYSQNMFSHLGIYETKLLKTVNGFRIGIEGSQDYDLMLRCLEHVEESQIHHIPRVLYHWRVHKESTSQSSDAKPYAMLAGERALDEHFQRIGVDAKAELIRFGYRVHYPLPEIKPLVSIIIPTRNGLALIQQCIKSIIDKTIYPNYEILIIDNGSDEPEVLNYFKSLSSESRISIHRDDRPFNFSQLNNSAVNLAKGEIIALVNNDIEVISPDWLNEMVSHALRPEVGAVGAKLWYPNYTIQHGGIVLGLGADGCAGHTHLTYPKGNHGYFGRLSLRSSYSAVSAACLVIKKSLYEKVGGLNEQELKVAFNDVDFCLRLREVGYRNVWTPYAELYHHESVSRGSDDNPINEKRFNAEVEYMKSQWGELLLNDPAYSPNLTFQYSDFSYAWPPRIELIGCPVE